MPIYLDHNATTPLDPVVLEAMLPFLHTHFGNPSSQHEFGRITKAAVDTARAQVARLIGAHPDEVIFTSGGTEASNMAILGAISHLSSPAHIITSQIEHPATSAPCRALQTQGHQVTWSSVTPKGQVDTDHVLSEIRPGHTALLTIMHAHNETGVLQPIAHLSAHTRPHGILVHTDAAQSLGKVPVSVDDLGVDLLTIAGHKLYAPKGVGALYIRRGTRCNPLLYGANHEQGRRPGTENVASIVGLGAACALAQDTLHHDGPRLERLRTMLFDALKAQIPALICHGANAPRLPNTLHIRFPHALGHLLLTHAPTLAASTGSACHDGAHTPSASIVAMGVPPEDALGSVRLSLGRSTTEQDVLAAAHALISAWKRCTTTGLPVL